MDFLIAQFKIEIRLWNEKLHCRLVGILKTSFAVVKQKLMLMGSKMVRSFCFLVFLGRHQEGWRHGEAGEGPSSSRGYCQGGQLNHQLNFVNMFQEVSGQEWVELM